MSLETDRSIGKLIERFLAHQDGRLRQAQISKARRESLRAHLATLSSEVGEATEIEEISPEFLSKYHHALSKMIDADRLTQTTASDKFAAAKTFIRWMWSEGIVMELPRNIDSCELTFTRTPREHRQFTFEEVHDILALPTPDRTRLYILLMLNCGFTQADVANLLPSEVDFEQGTITRKRTKTRGKTSVPVVRYTLWPKTLALLQQEQTEGGTRVLLNQRGEPLLTETLLESGKYKKTDNIRSAWNRLCKRRGVDLPLSGFRKTSASLLRSQPQFVSIYDHFLGHAPTSVADRHYAAAPQTVLEDGIRWLREEQRIAEVFAVDA